MRPSPYSMSSMRQAAVGDRVTVDRRRLVGGRGRRQRALDRGRQRRGPALDQAPAAVAAEGHVAHEVRLEQQLHRMFGAVGQGARTGRAVEGPDDVVERDQPLVVGGAVQVEAGVRAGDAHRCDVRGGQAERGRVGRWLRQPAFEQAGCGHGQGLVACRFARERRRARHRSPREADVASLQQGDGRAHVGHARIRHPGRDASDRVAKGVGEPGRRVRVGARCRHGQQQGEHRDGGAVRHHGPVPPRVRQAARLTRRTARARGNPRATARSRHPSRATGR